MKKTLIILLFFFYSLIAESVTITDLEPLNMNPFDLTGKILVCGIVPENNPNEMYIDAWAFKSEEKVIFIHYLQNEDIFEEHVYDYDAKISSIEILRTTLPHSINRQNLDVIYTKKNKENKVMYKGEHCVVGVFSISDSPSYDLFVKSFLNTFKEDLIYQSTKDNKL